jgi:hypothetical protein
MKKKNVGGREGGREGGSDEARTPPMVCSVVLVAVRVTATAVCVILAPVSRAAVPTIFVASSEGGREGGRGGWKGGKEDMER